jgi:hypothetical protein
MDGLASGVVARAAGRTIRKRPVPASSNTTLPKITGSGHRRRVLIMCGSTAQHTIPKKINLSVAQLLSDVQKMITG